MKLGTESMHYIRGRGGVNWNDKQYIIWTPKIISYFLVMVFGYYESGENFQIYKIALVYD